MTPDRELLRQYAEHGDEAAFAEIVRRQADMVYSVALRVTGNAALAQDVTQGAFTKLARHAGLLGGYTTPVGWLHTTTRRLAINAIRGEHRRRVREQEACVMQKIESQPDSNWSQLGPLLDEAVSQLRERDRQAVLLRFFKGLSHREVGAELGLTENSAQKCVDRALDKLREHFGRRGVTATAPILAAAISANSVQAAPVGLMEKITPASLAGATGGGGAALAFFWLMNNKIKTILAAAILLALTLGPAWRWSTAKEAPAPLVPARERTSVKLDTPPPPAPALPPRVELPTAPPVPVVEPAAVAAPPAPAQAADPRVKLDTAMSDFVNLLDKGDYVKAVNDYLQLSPDITATDVVNAQLQNPDFPNTLRMFMESTRAAMTGTPEYNGTGDVATYKLNPPVEGKTMVRWKKINDRWYVDGYE